MATWMKLAGALSDIIWKRPHFCMNRRFIKGAGGGQGAAQWLTSAVCACEPETGGVYVYTFPHAGQDSSSPIHESFNMSLLTIICCNNSHYGERAQVLDTVKQCRPFRDPTGICVIPHSSSYWDQVWAVSSCCWPLWKVTVGCRYAARYLNLANEPVLLVWIRSLGLNNESENREQQVCTNVKTCVDLLWR